MRSTAPVLRARARPLAACLAAAAVLFALSSCSSSLGWGVLLWSVDEPSVPAGSVVKVYIRSNINSTWVVGVPGSSKKVELPLWKLDFSGSKSKAQARSDAFKPFAFQYAEALQDGLPIRSEADNGAKRVYRLRQGQIVKVVSKSKGAPAMAGEKPLPGDWLEVLTDDGERGYCFSYRLRVFSQAAGTPKGTPALSKSDAADADLDQLLSKAWSPEAYRDMIDKRRVDLSKFSPDYGFFPGLETGAARIVMPGLDVEYPYTSVRRLRDGVWRFDGTPVQLTKRSDTVIIVQYVDSAGAQKSLVFVALPVAAKDVADQETERRAALLKALVERGPSLRSENYGTLTLDPSGSFEWSGYDPLVPSVVPRSAKSPGSVELRLFLEDSLAGQYDGALSLHFSGMAEGRYVDFLYKLEASGLKLEYLPSSCLDGVTVKQRAPSSLVLSFAKADR